MTISPERIEEIQNIPDADIDTSDILKLDENFWHSARIVQPLPEDVIRTNDIIERDNIMKPTTVYLPDTTEKNLEQLAHQTGRTQIELIQEAVEEYLARRQTGVLPSSVGLGASGLSNLSERTEELLWSDE